MEEPSLFSKSGSDHALQNRSKACKQFFRDCLERPDLDDDWLEEKCAEFNWWSSGLNADKRGPGSLDARLRLRPDVQDVIVDVLDGLKTALGKYYSIGRPFRVHCFSVYKVPSEHFNHVIDHDLTTA